MELKIATVNLCLGLKNKRIDVENLMIKNDIRILCLQEVEIENIIDTNLLKLKNYQFELENNSLSDSIENNAFLCWFKFACVGISTL